jgi:dephospho-CoA kinase
MGKSAGEHPFSVGLTGGIGSGKSTVADLFAEKGVSVIDTDLIAHQLTASGGLAIAPIRSAFGDEFMLPDGAMNRKKMRAAVFADPNAKKKLEAILHPLIRAETERAAAGAQGAYLLYVVPLLLESGAWKERVSRILTVDCPEELQIQRVMERNGFTEQQVRAIMKTQVSRAARVAAADDVITNDGNTAELQIQVERLHQGYLSLAKPY